ncbi:E3 ubiquitin protein ligase RIE1-like protein [Tanacetum coccineum]
MIPSIWLTTFFVLSKRSLMDRSWMYTAPRASKRYTNGVEYFLDFAFEKSSQNGTILCPCIDCQSLLFAKRALVYDHLICSGFKRGYLYWKDHGEVHEAAPLVPIKDGKGLTQLTVAFLAIDMFFAAIGILLSLLVGLGVCFCFPCIIGIMYLIRRQEEGASDADINILPKYIYAVSNDEEQPDLILSRMVPMGTNGPDFNVERFLLRMRFYREKNCPKMLGSPLTDTVNKSDTSRRIQQVQLCDMRSAKSEHVVFLFLAQLYLVGFRYNT